MFRESYTKFYLFIVASLLFGFVGMELATTGGVGGTLTGMVTVQGESSALGTGGNSLVFFLLGLFTGAVLILSMVYLYGYEKKRIV